MDNPTGTIQSLYRKNGAVRALVAVEAGIACPRCAAGKGCGAGLLANGTRQRVVEAAVRNSDSLAEGDRVEITMQPADLLTAAFNVYAMPLLGAMGAAAAAYYFNWGDLAAVMAVLSGVAAGFLLGRRRVQRNDCLSTGVPTVEKRPRAPQAGL